MKNPSTSASNIATSLQPFVDRGTLAGAVTALASKEAILCLDTVGFANVAERTLMAADTLFWIASQTKPMTATALMMLMDEDRLKLDDPVEKYLPEFKGQMVVVEQNDERLVLGKPSHPITVREILSHTSGLPFQSPIETPTYDMLPLDVAVRSHAMGWLKFEPGTKYEYSNAGTNTAGRLVEVLSGLPYKEFMRTRLFDPLGMNDTTFIPDEKQVQRLAKSYKPHAANTGIEETPINQLHHPLTDQRRQPMPAGGLFSTAADVIRFCQMILNDGELDGKRYISADAIREMTRKQTGKSIEKSYGLGWDTENGVFGHGGAFSTFMTIDRQRGAIILFLVQHAGWPGEGGKCIDAFKESVNAWLDENPIAAA